MTSDGMKVFLTGASGFIGSRVAYVLTQRGHFVQELKARLEDINAVQDELDAFCPDVVMHLAWEGIPDLGQAMSAKNLASSMAFLKAVAERCVGKTIVAGSSYQRPGVDPGNHQYFIAAKNTIRDEGGALIRQAGGTFIWTYPFFVYGPGKRSGSLIPMLIADARAGKVPQAKNPSAWHDFIYVDDVAEALSLLAEKGTSGEYDIGSGTLTRTGAIANMVAKKFGFDSPALQKMDEYGAKADIRELQKATGWRPRVSIEEGTARMIAQAETSS